MRSKSLGIITVGSPSTPVSVGNVFATVVGTDVAPFNITVANDKLLIAVDGAGVAQTLTLTHGAAQSAASVVADINAQSTGITASAPGGKIQISSNTTGPSSQLSIQAITNSAYVTLGFSVGDSFGLNGVKVAKLRFIALKGNQGDVYIGNVPNFDKTTGQGMLDRIIKPLATPASLDSMIVESQQDSNVLNTGEYFIDADNSNDGVLVVCWVA